MSKRQEIFFEFIKTIPIIDTNQVATLFFSECNSPTKRASEFLQELCKNGDIEGQRREIGKTKIWRLTRKKKKEMGIKKRSVPFTIQTIDHILEIGNIYVQLIKQEKLDYFQFEIREEFIGKDKKEKQYCPDAFFVYEDQPYFLELQRSPISSSRWKEKWKYAVDFICNNHYEKFYDKVMREPIFQTSPFERKKPRILTISKQRKEIVLNGIEDLKIDLYETIESFTDKEESEKRLWDIFIDELTEISVDNVL